MLEKDDGGNLRCKTFREFCEAYVGDRQFRFWLVLLEQNVIDLADFEKGKDIETQVILKNDIRPLRLLAIRFWCRMLMRNVGYQLGIETPPPDEVLLGVSTQLTSCITTVQVDQVESYLMDLESAANERHRHKMQNPIITVVYSHGRHGSPWYGFKIEALRPIALALGINMISVRYPEEMPIAEMEEKLVSVVKDDVNVPGDLVLS